MREIIGKTYLSMGMRRPAVGCAIQGDDCLALKVVNDPDGWAIDWALGGCLKEEEFRRELASKTGKIHLWVPLLEEGALQSSVSVGVELGALGEERLDSRTRLSAMRTQTLSRLPEREGVILRGCEMADVISTDRHLVGSAAIRRRVVADLKMWSKDIKVRNPHLASTSMALANSYLALYYERNQKETPLRFLVLEGRTRSRGIVMDGWKFTDSLELKTMQGHRMNKLMIDQWVSEVSSRHRFATPPVPLVVLDAGGTTEMPYETWTPFPHPRVHMTDAFRAMVEENQDLATVAFGMALQGGA